MEVKQNSTNEVDLLVSGMTCASCANRIERKLNKLENVEATVNFATDKAHVSYTGNIDADLLIDTIRQAGYDASLDQAQIETEEQPHNPHDHPADTQEMSSIYQRFIISAILSAPVVVLAMIPALQFRNWQWLSLTLASPVVIWGAYPFHKVAWTNAKHGSSTMDTLISIGTIGAFAWSVYALFFGNAGMENMTHSFDLAHSNSDASSNIYLEAAAGVTTLILAGRYFEVKSKHRAGLALKAILELGAKEVSVLRESKEVTIPITQIVVGDHFVVRPGEKIATDGVILDGTSSIDSSMVTGESVPVDVGQGDHVFGATINVSGRIVIEAMAVGAQTQLSQMAKLVENAQNTKARAQQLADRISGIFVPIVIIIAVITFIAWNIFGSSLSTAMSATIAVLIIACPCALGLATPMALMVGTGRGAQLGIIIRDHQALETAKKIDTIVFDKTGTITSGNMEVVEVIPDENIDRDQLILFGASIENASEHPIAKVIAKYGVEHENSLLDIDKFINIQGLGVEGDLAYNGEAYKIYVGRQSFLEENGCVVSPFLKNAIVESKQYGKTTVVVGWDNQAKGVFILTDTIKETSKKAIENFVSLGLKPYIITGDNQSVAQSVAQQVGVPSDNVYAEVLPQEKLAIIKSLQENNRTVAMVGDGVNDSPALAQSDLGIAMGTGSDVAKHASDLTLVHGDLLDAFDALRLSRATLRTIKGNLFWAFAYNVAALPLAAFSMLNPMIAGAAMAFSSVFVVSNSLRLRNFKRFTVE